jgi:hypothetical protein
MPEKPPVRVLVAVALVTACTLALQVVLTRLFSAVLAYHFSFVAISLALLGTGAGALFVYLVPRWFDQVPLEKLLARWSALFGALLVVIPFGLVRLDLSQDNGITVGFVANLAAACLFAALPSLAAGVVIALAINGYTRWIGRVYAFDLVGAGLGALVVVPVLWLSDAPTLVVALGILAFAAAVLFAPPAATERLAATGLVVVGAGVVALSVTTSVLFLPPRYALPTNARMITDQWNPLSRVIGYDFPSLRNFAAVFYNRDYAPVPKVRGDEIPDWRQLGTGPQSMGYELTGPGRTLIIGGGGGRDIYTALSAGQSPVDVIELNEGIRTVVDEDLARFSGSPYSRPHVSTTIGDGRSVLAARDTKYNVLHIGFTNTLSANAASGFVLTENNLYTIEAFQEYFDHLAPDGVLDISRIRKGGAGDEGIKATVLMLAAVEREGVKHPERNVVVVLGRDILGEESVTILARRNPFTPDELAKLRQLGNERGRGVIFAPGGPYVDEWKQLADAHGWRSFCANYRLNVCPPTDNKPFFFNMTRLSQIGTSAADSSADPFQILMITLGILVALSVLAFLLPFRFARERARPTVGSLSYFVAIGLGFLLLEIVLIQRFVLFLGFPTYALSVVLFALLIFTGVGSAISTRFTRTRESLLVALGVVVALTVLGAYGLQPVLRGLISLPFAARVAIAVTLLAPLGIVLGTAMPIGLRRFQALHPSGVAYAWGVNGVASVLASVLGVALAINFGFAITSLVAAACYLGAVAHAAFGKWPEAATTVDAAPKGKPAPAARTEPDAELTAR